MLIFKCHLCALHMFVGTGLEVVQAVIKAIRTKIHLVKWFELLLSICLLLFLINFIGIQLLYNVVLVSTVQQSESAICIHMSPFLDFLPI